MDNKTIGLIVSCLLTIIFDICNFEVLWSISIAIWLIFAVSIIIEMITTSKPPQR